MSALVVDTSAWISYFRGEEQPELETSLREGLVFLPPLVVAELFSGKMTETQRSNLESLIRDLEICKAPVDHWIRVGKLRSALASKGLTISTPDAHVAQCTLDLGGRLLTEDGVFELIAKLTTLALAPAP